MLWAIVWTLQFDTCVLSTHKTKEAAEAKAERLNKPIMANCNGPKYRVLAVGPDEPSEIIKVFGRTIVRPK